MPLPDDILPEDEPLPGDEEVEGGAAPEAEPTPDELDTLQAEFDSLAQATQQEFDANNQPVEQPQFQTHSKEEPAPAERPEESPTEVPGDERNHWDELKEQSQKIAETGQPQPPEQEPGKSKPFEAPTLRDFYEQGGEIPDLSEGASEDFAADPVAAALTSHEDLLSLVVQKLIDHSRVIDQLRRRLEMDGL